MKQNFSNECKLFNWQLNGIVFNISPRRHVWSLEPRQQDNHRESLTLFPLQDLPLPFQPSDRELALACLDWSDARGRDRLRLRRPSEAPPLRDVHWAGAGSVQGHDDLLGKLCQVWVRSFYSQQSQPETLQLRTIFIAMQAGHCSPLHSAVSCSGVMIWR